MTTPYRIPFNRSSPVGHELKYIEETLLIGQIAGDQTYTKKCRVLLEREMGVAAALLTPSCTHALEMVSLLLRIRPGDEVIVPSFTFVSTANAFAIHGARPVFVDSRRDTLNIDETKIEAAITPRTKAIVVVHYAGVACEMDAIMAIGAKHGIPVIEDNAHGPFARYRGRFLGTFGAFATLSFHETKNYTCGEGGALLINAPEFIDRAEIIREKGTNRSRFFRGQVDKYSWVDYGSSYVMSDVLSAFLYGQIENHQAVMDIRSAIWNRYQAAFGGSIEQFGAQVPFVPAHCDQSFHMYYLILPSLAVRQALITHLKSRGILAVFHYLPLHTSDMGRSFGGAAGDCPVAEDVADRILRLPFFNALTEPDQADVIAAVFEFFNSAR